MAQKSRSQESQVETFAGNRGRDKKRKKLDIKQIPPPGRRKKKLTL